jgi:hypothetical protein
MDLRGYLIRVGDGVSLRHTVVLAPDSELARRKAIVLFKDTKWRVLVVAEIGR